MLMGTQLGETSEKARR